MKFYPKKLRNIEKLKKERKRLLMERKALEEDGFFSMAALTGKDDHEGKVKGGGGLLDMIQPENPLVQGIMELLKAKLLQRFNNSNNGNEGSPLKAKVVSAAKDVAFGYIKWKAIELSYKGLKYLINKRKSKNQEETEATS